MAVRVVHANPFSSRVLEEIENHDYSLEEFHSLLVRLLQRDDVRPSDFITDKGGLLELDLARVLREFEKLESSRNVANGDDGRTEYAVR